MAIGRPTKPLDVTPEEKEKLTMLVRRAANSRPTARASDVVIERPQSHGYELSASTNELPL